MFPLSSSSRELAVMIAHVSCRRSGVPANHVVQGSNFEVLANGFGNYGGKYIFDTF